jgi:hypothetical protein
MADEMFGSNGDYLSAFVNAFNRFQSDRLEVIHVISKTRQNEEFLSEFFNGSSDERTTLYSVKVIGLFIRGISMRKETKVTKTIFNSCRVTTRRGSQNQGKVVFYDDSNIPPIPQNELDMMNATFASSLPVSTAVAPDLAMPMDVISELQESSICVITTCNGIWKSLYSDLYRGDIGAVASHLKCEDSFAFLKYGISVKRVDDSQRPFQIHDIKCSGSFEGKGFKNKESGISYPYCSLCNKKKVSSSLRDMVSSLEKNKTNIAEDVVNKFSLNEGTFISDRAIRDLSQTDAVSVIINYFKGNFYFITL